MYDTVCSLCKVKVKDIHDCTNVYVETCMNLVVCLLYKITMTNLSVILLLRVMQTGIL